MAKTWLVTGTSSGLGLGLAKAALAQGERVLAMQRRSSPLSAHSGFHEARIDLTEHAHVASAVRGLIAGVEAIDCVVLNSGTLGPIQDLTDTPLHVLQRTMEINLWANKTLLDALFASGVRVDQVVGISSGAAVSGSRGWNGYALSKAAFLMLLKLYAAERSETHFCSFAPGLVDTAMQDELASLSEEAVERFSSLRRIQQARGTESMPDPDQAGAQFIALFDRLRDEPSGSYVDVRTWAGRL